MLLIKQMINGHNIYGYIVWKFWCELTIDEQNAYVWKMYKSVDIN